jgi:hypothetical protein
MQWHELGNVLSVRATPGGGGAVPEFCRQGLQSVTPLASVDAVP